MTAAHTIPHPRRWQRRPDERPRQILEAAFRVFGARGLHQATLDDVARQAGITKGTIYLYFPSKAALFSAMLKARVNDCHARGGRAPGRRPRPAPGRLAALGRDLYRFFRSPAYLAMYRTMVSEVAEFPETAALLYREGILPANRRLAEVIRAGSSPASSGRWTPWWPPAPSPACSRSSPSPRNCWAASGSFLWPRPRSFAP